MLTELKIENFRSFEKAEFSFPPGRIIFEGGNGQGKTSILESIYFIANLRSFRTLKPSEICRIGTPFFRISARHENKGGWKSLLEVRYGEEKSFSIDHIPVGKASDFTGRMRCVTFLPDDPLLISGTYVLRRRFMDMFISLLNREYYSCLQNYSFALRSRNFLLKNFRNRDEKEKAILDSYNSILASCGSFLVEKRKEYIKILSEETEKVISIIRPELANFQIRMRYNENTEKKESFRKKLENDFFRDMQKGFTSTGPHQDELDFLADEKSLRTYGSRGQLRTASFALKLAQYRIMNEAGKMPGSTAAENIVLVDDVLGDLDKKAREAFFREVTGRGQIFYTFTEVPEEIKEYGFSAKWKISSGKAVESN
ncbi:MAG: DNA replication and repair protein RecF [Lentisphaeria bacterium]|nr:DNA replication and repair protein RecF [Lentisphaeria bacterium]